MDEANIAVDVGELPEGEDAGRTTNLQGQHPRDLARLRLGLLTPAELDIVLWMYRGYTTDDELGRALFRSPHTVRTQVASVFGKLNLHSRTELVTWLQRAASTAPAPAKRPRPTDLDIDPEGIFSE
jgi:DNA-binding CsgD family transcriptional regulator